MPKLGIIVLAWNGVEFLPQCLGAIKKTDYPQGDLFFILVDNGSDDESLELLKAFRQENPGLQVEVVHNPKNLGFAAGNNVGLKRAQELGLDYAITLNQDIQETNPEWARLLVETLEQNPKVAAVQARVMRYPDKDKVNCVGNKYHFLGFGYTGGNMRDYVAPGEPLQEVPYASGSALCLRMELFGKYGGFQEETFMYHDDLELCLRYRLLGYRVACQHRAVAYHKFEFERSIKKYYWQERNRIWFLLEYYKIRTLVLILPMFLLMEGGLLLFSLRSGFFWSKLKSQLYFLVPWHWVAIFRRRKYIQSVRRISDKELFEWATPVIEDQEVENGLLDRVGNPLMKAYFKILKKLI